MHMVQFSVQNYGIRSIPKTCSSLPYVVFLNCSSFLISIVTRIPHGAARICICLLKLGGVGGRAAAPSRGCGWLCHNVLRSAGGPEWKHEPGLPSCSSRIRPLHRDNEGKRAEDNKALTVVMRGTATERVSSQQQTVFKMYALIVAKIVKIIVYLWCTRKVSQLRVGSQDDDASVK